jgi:hypothetical protein
LRQFAVGHSLFSIRHSAEGTPLADIPIRIPVTITLPGAFLNVGLRRWRGPCAICEWVSESNPHRQINPAGGLSRSPSGQAFTVSAKSSKNQPVANIFERVTQTVLARKDHAMKHSNSVLYSQPRSFRQRPKPMAKDLAEWRRMRSNCPESLQDKTASHHKRDPGLLQSKNREN